MAPCHNRRSNRSALFVALLCATLLASVRPARAQDTSSQTAKATLVVWARTDLANQGAPTLDLLDLERYFVEELTKQGIENVVPSSTAQIARPPGPRIYLLELSVVALEEAHRAKWDDTHTRYEDQPIFHVELSLAVKHLASGRLLGSTGERREYELSYDNMRHVVAKRGVIYDTASHLADRFLDETTAGAFGQDLAELQAPIWKRLPDWALPAGLCVGVLLILLLLCIASARHESVRADFAREAETYERWNARIIAAMAESFSTNGFSLEWYRATARVRLKEILQSASEVERKEAEQRVQERRIEAKYEEIGAYAARTHGLDKVEIIEMLRKADEHPYRLLQTAKEIYEEA